MNEDGKKRMNEDGKKKEDREKKKERKKLIVQSNSCETSSPSPRLQMSSLSAIPTALLAG